MIRTIDECFWGIQNGANIKQSKSSGGFPITRIETIADNKFNRDRVGYAGITDVSSYESYILEDEDLLMSHINSAKYLGRTVLYNRRANEVIIHGMNLLRLRANKEIINPSYAKYLFSGCKFKKQVSRITKKSVNQASFTVGDLKKIKISVPSILEQVQIVEKLDKIAGIIELRQAEIEKAEEIIKARFIEVFGDPVLNSMKWEEHKLSEYILFMTSGSRGWSKYFTDDGSEVFITIKNVKNNKITLKEIQFVNAPDDKEAKRTKVQAGDLLISITADLGRTGVVSNEIAKQGAYINQHLSLIRLDVSKINPHFVSYYLETEAGKRQFASKNQSAVKAGLSFESIKSLKIFVPPMELQRDYVLFTEQADKSKLPNTSIIYTLFVGMAYTLPGTLALYLCAKLSPVNGDMGVPFQVRSRYFSRLAVLKLS